MLHIINIKCSNHINMKLDNILCNALNSGLGLVMSFSQWNVSGSGMPLVDRNFKSHHMGPLLFSLCPKIINVPTEAVPSAGILKLGRHTEQRHSWPEAERSCKHEIILYYCKPLKFVCQPKYNLAKVNLHEKQATLFKILLLTGLWPSPRFIWLIIFLQTRYSDVLISLVCLFLLTTFCLLRLKKKKCWAKQKLTEKKC